MGLVLLGCGSHAAPPPVSQPKDVPQSSEIGRARAVATKLVPVWAGYSCETTPDFGPSALCAAAKTFGDGCHVGSPLRGRFRDLSQESLVARIDCADVSLLAFVDSAMRILEVLAPIPPHSSAQELFVLSAVNDTTDSLLQLSHGCDEGRCDGSLRRIRVEGDQFIFEDFQLPRAVLGSSRAMAYPEGVAVEGNRLTDSGGEITVPFWLEPRDSAVRVSDVIPSSPPVELPQVELRTTDPALVLSQETSGAAFRKTIRELALSRRSAALSTTQGGVPILPHEPYVDRELDWRVERALWRLDLAPTVARLTAPDGKARQFPSAAPRDALRALPKARTGFCAPVVLAFDDRVSGTSLLSWIDAYAKERGLNCPWIVSTRGLPSQAPEGRFPRVSLEKSSHVGRFSFDDIRAGLESHHAELIECYEKGLKEDPLAVGDLWIDIQSASGGRVESVDIDPLSSLLLESTAHCVQRAFTRLALPNHPGPGNLRLFYRFWLGN